jgi:uncharacterized RDD family membrane protein YckC
MSDSSELLAAPPAEPVEPDDTNDEMSAVSDPVEAVPDSEDSVALSEQPAVLDTTSAPPAAQAPRAGTQSRDAPTFYAAGFWHRVLAGCIDLAAIVPVALLVYLLVGRMTGVGLPPSRHHGVDFWLDLMLAGDPALITLAGLLVAVATIYVLVFQLTWAYTLGMRVMKIRIIDQYGTPLSTLRAVARTAGYLASAVSLGLGFIWIGFDSEKRGLQDWLSGTYVVKA